MNFSKCALWIGLVLYGTSASAVEREVMPAKETDNNVPMIGGKVEAWKGTPDDRDWLVSAGVGFGDVAGENGLLVKGDFSRKVIHQGFAPDINNQVFFELSGGPLLASGHTAFWFSSHLRWDFYFDSKWAFFAIGGIGGGNARRSGSRSWFIYPRTGLGTFYSIADNVRLRAELSHEATTIGVAFPF